MSKQPPEPAQQQTHIGGSDFHFGKGGEVLKNLMGGFTSGVKGIADTLNTKSKLDRDATVAANMEGFKSRLAVESAKELREHAVGLIPNVLENYHPKTGHTINMDASGAINVAGTIRKDKKQGKGSGKSSNISREQFKPAGSTDITFMEPNPEKVQPPKFSG